MYGDLFNFGYRLFPFAAFVPCVDLSRLGLLPCTPDAEGKLDGGDGSHEGLCDAAVWSVVARPGTDQNEHLLVYVILAPEVGRHQGCPSADLMGNWEDFLHAGGRTPCRAGCSNNANPAAGEAAWSVDQQAFVEQCLCFADDAKDADDADDADDANDADDADDADAIALHKTTLGGVSAQTLVADLKMKARRKKLDRAQVAILKAVFRENDMPNRVQKKAISLRVGLSMPQVATWFNNRRKPERN
jgi:hypothetical protein